MLLSVCIPTYNRSNSLRKTLSFLTKEYTALPSNEKLECEIIVRDNCSIDETKDVVLDIIKDNPYILYKRNEENIGASPNFVKITNDANGDYVWWLGDDDMLRSGILNLIVKYLRKYEPELLFINHRAGDFFNNIIEFESAVDTNIQELYTDGKEGICEIVRHSGVGPLLFLSSKVVKKSTLNESFIGVVFPSGTLTLHTSFYAATKGAIAIIPDICIENDYQDISWKERQEQIAFKEIPETLSELKELSYTKDQISIIHRTYFSFARKQQIFIYNLKQENKKILHSLFSLLFKFEIKLNKLVKIIVNAVK